MALYLINESVLVIRYAYFKLPVLKAICPSYILISTFLFPIMSNITKIFAIVKAESNPSIKFNRHLKNNAQRINQIGIIITIRTKPTLFHYIPVNILSK